MLCDVDLTDITFICATYTMRRTGFCGSIDEFFKLDQIKGWLAEGSKVKISVKFKGRLKAHLFLGEDVLHRYEEDLKECGVIEKAPQYAGKFMSMIVAPIKKK